MNISPELFQIPEAIKQATFKIGTVTALFENGYPQITFDGEGSASQKQYSRLSSYDPVVNDRVLLASISGTYVVLGKIGIGDGSTTDITASEILALLKTVDGAGSGLDADLLDGQHGDYYKQASGITQSGTLANAEGLSTTASGNTSRAQNAGTIAQGMSQTAIGRYNIAQGTYDSVQDSDFAFILGNGADDANRSNAFTVDWAGNFNIPAGADYKINGVGLASRISGKNFIINPDFTINQRGQSSYSGSGVYTVDMWRLGTAAGTLTVNSDGSITLNSSAANFELHQKLPDLPLLNGKLVTASVQLSDGTIYSGTCVVDTNTDGTPIMVSLGSTGFNLELRIIPASSYYVLRLRAPLSGQTVNIKRIKLELGSVSTLANDPPAHEGEQLALCQWYLYRINNESTLKRLGSGFCLNSTTAYIYLGLPVEMRITPTVNFSNCKVATTSGNYGITGIALAWAKNQAGLIVTSSSLTTGAPCYLRMEAADVAHIEFSAEL